MATAWRSQVNGALSGTLYVVLHYCRETSFDVLEGKIKKLSISLAVQEPMASDAIIDCNQHR